MIAGEKTCSGFSKDTSSITQGSIDPQAIAAPSLPRSRHAGGCPLDTLSPPAPTPLGKGVPETERGRGTTAAYPVTPALYRLSRSGVADLTP